MHDLYNSSGRVHCVVTKLSSGSIIIESMASLTDPIPSFSMLQDSEDKVTESTVKYTGC